MYATPSRCSFKYFCMPDHQAALCTKVLVELWVSSYEGDQVGLCDGKGKEQVHAWHIIAIKLQNIVTQR